MSGVPPAKFGGQEGKKGIGVWGKAHSLDHLGIKTDILIHYIHNQPD
jgi:hypothetical protein